MEHFICRTDWRTRWVASALKSSPTYRTRRKHWSECQRVVTNTWGGSCLICEIRAKTASTWTSTVRQWVSALYTNWRGSFSPLDVDPRRRQPRCSSCLRLRCRRHCVPYDILEAAYERPNSMLPEKREYSAALLGSVVSLEFSIPRESATDQLNWQLCMHGHLSVRFPFSSSFFFLILGKIR